MDETKPSAHDDRARVRGHFHDPERYDDTRFRAPVVRERAARAQRCFLAVLPDPAGPGTVLEVGAGSGRYTRLALERGFRVTATDANVEMVQFLARELEPYVARGACRVEQADVFALPYGDGAFDAAVCMSLIGRFDDARDQETALAEICRIVRPRGWLVFNMRNPRSPFSLWRGKGGLSERALRRVGETIGLTIESRRRVHFVDRGAVWRWPSWLARLAVRADAVAAAIPGLPAHTLLYRARRTVPSGPADIGSAEPGA